MGDFGHGGGGRSFAPRRSFGGPRSDGPREMHKAKCSDCQADCEVPFPPSEGRPVYCKDCWAKRRTF